MGNLSERAFYTNHHSLIVIIIKDGVPVTSAVGVANPRSSDSKSDSLIRLLLRTLRKLTSLLRLFYPAPEGC